MARSTKKHYAPKFTSGLESKLTGLLGEPCALATKLIIRTLAKIHHEDPSVTVVTEGQGKRHIISKYLVLHYYNPQIRSLIFPDEVTQITAPSMRIQTTHNYRFLADLFEDENGKLVSFNFTLSVS